MDRTRRRKPRAAATTAVVSSSYASSSYLILVMQMMLCFVLLLPTKAFLLQSAASASSAAALFNSHHIHQKSQQLTASHHNQDVFIELFERQQQQIDLLSQLLVQQQQQIQQQHPTTKNPLLQQQLDTTTDTSSSASPSSTLNAMLFIDGTWLYYSMYERRPEECPICQRYGIFWKQTHRVDWSALLRITSNALQVNTTVARVFTSYKADTLTTSFRYKMFQELQTVPNVHVSMMETVGASEKCVDIQLAVDMLHHAPTFDVAVLLSGDKDFLPALLRTRQQQKRIALVSMKRGCNKALVEVVEGEYPVVWLEDHLEELIVPRTDAFVPQDVNNGAVSDLSVFTLLKVLRDFVRHSPAADKVSSRDVGRYLKTLRFGALTMLDELKLAYGGLSLFLKTHGLSVFGVDDSNSSFNSKNSNYWISVLPGVDEALLKVAKLTKFSQAEKDFFETYTLEPLQDKGLFYWFTNELDRDRPVIADSKDDNEPEVEIPDHLTKDYSACTVAQLKETCRKRNLLVSGVKSALLDRLQASLDEEIRRIRNNATESQTEREPNGVSASSSPYVNSYVVPNDVADHIKELVLEYMLARGGSASSRDIGRYLSANSSSSAAATNVSALQELKAFYGSLAGFVHCFPDIFTRSEVAESHHPKDYGFNLFLRDGVTSAVS